MTLTSPEPTRLAAPLPALPAPAPEGLDLLVVVGTDYHPFDRLVQWVDEWVALQGAGYRAVVQYGSGKAPVVAEGSASFAHDELRRLMSLARVVVMHGGPASILEARRLGKVPVVVPREPGHGEHVDSHQVRFTRRLSESGLVALCVTQADFVFALTGADSDPARLRVLTMSTGLGAFDNRDGVEAVRRIVDDLITRRSGSPVMRMLSWYAKR